MDDLRRLPPLAPTMETRRRPARALVAGVLALITGFGGVLARAGGPPAPPSAEERLAYWMDRLLEGPEPTTYAIPNFHGTFLADMERNLIALGPRTLDRLADPSVAARLQSGSNPAAWEATLAVLAALGRQRPDVARAWAVPAMRSRDLTLRRAAAPVLTALADPVDGETLEAALRRDAGDRTLGPQLLEAMLRLGAPWSARAARVVLERATADRPDGASLLWDGLPAAAQAAGGAAAGADLLAWWALLAEASGPRAPGAARPGVPRAAESGPTSRVVVRLEHGLTSGRGSAAVARALLAEEGHAAYRASVAADLRSGDALLVRIARSRAVRAASEEERAAARAEAASFLKALRAADPAATPDRAAALIEALAADPSSDGASLLESLFASLPAGPAWNGAALGAWDALARAGHEPVAALQPMLFGADPGRVERALSCLRRARGPEAVAALEAWTDTPASAPWARDARRDLAFLYARRVAEGGVDAERLLAFARRLRGWAEDPSDPSAPQLASALLDLGPPGAAQVAEGLRGARRALYLQALHGTAGRDPGPQVIDALLAPITASTPREEVRAVLDIVFALATGSAAPALEALVERLPREPRADAEAILRVVRHRASEGT